MSVLVYLETSEGLIKKSSFEAISYAAQMAAGEVLALVAGNPGNLQQAAQFGAAKR